MSILVSLYFLISILIKTIKCAPKLGHILFDPIAHEAKLTARLKGPDDQQDLLKANLRISTNIEVTSKKLCSGYDYDETVCKTIYDRVICGYNKNIGDINDKTVNLGNGCRIRGDRVECGYFEGPFNIPRRPSLDYDTHESHTKNVNLRYGNPNSSNLQTQFNVSLKQNNHNFTTTTSKNIQNLKINSENTTKTTNSITKTSPLITSFFNTSSIKISNVVTTSRSNITSISRRRSNITKSKRYCVDKSDHIFCYSVRQR